jgi:flagellar biosynthetic protein FliO
MEGGMGATALQTLVALAAVCGLAVVLLRQLAPRLAAGTGNMHVLERLAIEPGRSLVVVRVADRTLLLGSSDAGIAQIADLSDEETAGLFETAAAPEPIVSRETWRRIVSRETSEVGT